ncbi:DUF1289 domain-containing protein [Pantoea sp. Ap-967]|uniref:DUF1289 domain-containing protein n=1 Tax=Pantoea sp. Ap-967 TaxID=2608362 RepID=UPI001423DA76|nr:DUF1289 domain-containing protein [Pantoea sp. Ap-967]NIE77121.1 DUF1289 domain-containing protein [Pantoea sp. Ap-967]
MSPRIVKTPCVGLCSTVYGDSVCRGCKRFDYEIIAWNGYSTDEKLLILRRLDTLLFEVMERMLEIFDVELLQKQLDFRGVRYISDQSPYAWCYQLLRLGASVIKDPSRYGFCLKQEYEFYSLVEVRDVIDREFFLLAEKCRKLNDNGLLVVLQM